MPSRQDPNRGFGYNWVTRHDAEFSRYKGLLKINALVLENTMLPYTEKRKLCYTVSFYSTSNFTLNLQTYPAYITPDQPKHNKLNICFLMGEGLFILWFI